VKLPLRSLVTVNRLSLTLVTIVVVVALFLSEVPMLDLVELQTYDLRFLSRGFLPPSAAVVLVTIDEKSLETEGRWPWPRSKLAAVVDRVSADGAKVIAFDIGFLEPDENSGLALLDHVGRTIGALGVANPDLDAFLAATREHADNDRTLAHAISVSSATVVLGYFFHMSHADLAYDIDQGEIDRRLELIASSKYPLVMYRGVDPDAVVVPRAYVPETNLPPLTVAAESSGYFNVRQDRDGVVRWMPLVIAGGEELFPPLSVVAAWQYLDRPRLAVRVDADGIEGIQMGDRVIPTDETGRLLINYLGPPKTFPHVSASDVLGGTVPVGTFRDRIVLIGATATGIYDARSTPFSPVYPGAEIQATVIDNILTRNFIAKPGWSRTYDVLAIVVLAALVGIALPHLSPALALLFTVALFALNLAVARELFVRYGLWLNVVCPLLAVIVNYTALSTYHYVVEQRERRKLRGAFGRYVAPAVIEHILEDPTRLELGGQEQVLTVLFSDLQGFTSYSEHYTPHEMFQFLSEYYGRMTERIFAHEGMLKEYVGDELMAIFGAPIEQKDHAVRACAAALDMRTHRKAMTQEWLAIGRPPLIARTGVNSGPMLVGNLGSEYRLTYGVLGDSVNLGSRLEGLNKEYGTEILIGETTAELVRDAFVLREVDLVRVVGKKKPTRIYELRALANGPLSIEEETALHTYAAALEAYRAQRWDDALGLFAQVLAHSTADGPSLVMMRRCRAYGESPPGADWDGVFEATRK
jgi:adenylate cyclase